jgi:hypothetical protein
MDMHVLTEADIVVDKLVDYSTSISVEMQPLWDARMVRQPMVRGLLRQPSASAAQQAEKHAEV